jgi:carbon-monoxide dehydrogenase small subunit
MKTINIRINGEKISHPVDDRLSLADFVRDHCQLTGTHVGCEQGVCGACTLMLNDEPVRSCITLAVAADGMNVRTVEGYRDDPLMQAIRTAFNRRHALQCGFCTPGMLATAYDILSRISELDHERIRAELGGNFCRCTGYLPIIQAIEDVYAERAPSMTSKPAIQAAE